MKIKIERWKEVVRVEIIEGREQKPIDDIFNDLEICVGFGHTICRASFKKSLA